jgi:hypothetical protein
MEIEIRNMVLLQNRIVNKVRRYGPSKVTVKVGYATSYAAYQHEVGPYKAPTTRGTQYKFLETPARTEINTLVATAINTLRARGTVRESILMTGETLLAMSKKIVPVDLTPLLKSAFVRVVRN